jgi:phosphohistidine phosphatase
MKSVILIRHVKSDWSNLVEDFDRPIREDRKIDALTVATKIAKRNDIPQVVIASPAKRTQQTAKQFCRIWHFKISSMVITNKALYECTAATILALINKVD